MNTTIQEDIAAKIYFINISMPQTHDDEENGRNLYIVLLLNKRQNNITFSQNTTNSFTDNEDLYLIPLKQIIIFATISIGLVLNSLIIFVITYGSLLKTSVFMILLLVLAIADNATLFFRLCRVEIMK